MSRKIDVLICGSANDWFFSNIAFMRMSLDALGGDYRRARLVAVLADYDRPEIPPRWQPHFKSIEVDWVNPEGRPNPAFLIQHYQRFEIMRPDADVAIICDADVAIMRPFDALLDEIIRDQALAGVIAHYHFSIDKTRGDPDVDWPLVARAVLGRDIARRHRYLYGVRPEDGPITDPEARPLVPFYANYGVLIGPPEQLHRMYVEERALTPAIAEVVDMNWVGQIGIALACEKLEIPVRALPPRYNYANRPETDQLYPEEQEKIVFFHYLFGRTKYHRQTLFCQPDKFDAFIAEPLTGGDEHFRQHVIALTGGRFPFPQTPQV